MKTVLRYTWIVCVLLLAALSFSASSVAQDDESPEYLYIRTENSPPPCTEQQMADLRAALAGEPNPDAERPPVDPDVHPDSAEALCTLPVTPVDYHYGGGVLPRRGEKSPNPGEAPPSDLVATPVPTDTISSASTNSGYAHMISGASCSGCSYPYEGMSGVAGHVSAQYPSVPGGFTRHYANRIHTFIELQESIQCSAGASQARGVSVGVARGTFAGNSTQMQVFWEYFDNNDCVTIHVTDINGSNTGFISPTVAPRFAILRSAVSANSVTLQARIKLNGAWHTLGSRVFNNPPHNAILDAETGQEIYNSSGGVDQISSPYNFINNINLAISVNTSSGFWYPWHTNVVPSKYAYSGLRNYPFC